MASSAPCLRRCPLLSTANYDRCAIPLRRLVTLRLASPAANQKLRQEGARKLRLVVSSKAEEGEARSGKSRRDLLIGVSAAVVSGQLLASSGVPQGGEALGVPSFSAPPPGFRLYVDRFDGYSFYIPETWLQVRGSGQDCFFRSPSALDENISVQVSSPSSSRFVDISDLGSPEEAGQQLLRQFLNEFMSTRLGVRRQPQLLRTAVRNSWDGDEYYEIELNVKSFANNNQMAILPEERPTMLEWDRHYLTVLGVANNRLYQLRAQVPEQLLGTELAQLRQILNSFQTFEILSV